MLQSVLQSPRITAHRAHQSYGPGCVCVLQRVFRRVTLVVCVCVLQCVTLVLCIAVGVAVSVAVTSQRASGTRIIRLWLGVCFVVRVEVCHSSSVCCSRRCTYLKTRRIGYANHMAPVVARP